MNPLKISILKARLSLQQTLIPSALFSIFNGDKRIAVLKSRKPLGMKALFDTMPQTGTVQWIGIRPSKKAPLKVVTQIELSPENGLAGDHYKGRNQKRQVTLIQQEHLDVVASILKLDHVDPSLTRRNIVVQGINLLAFKDQYFSIGHSLLKMTGLCHPCSRMEENLGAGGYNSMRGHGGITAMIIKEGVVEVGSLVKLELNPILPSIPQG